MDEYLDHIELAKSLWKQQGWTWDDKHLSPPVIHFFGPQVVVVQEYNSGPGEIDTLSIVGFYIPHDAQCTVAVNHMDGLATLDNADLMFPS